MNYEEEREPEGDRVQMLGWRLSRLAQEQVGIRQQIEDRWLDDLEQYMGRYDAATLERLKLSNGSQAFINITRPKTTAAEARISDMLFPTDDRNWGIQPTPIPEYQGMVGNQNVAGVDESGREVTHDDIAKQHTDEATKRSEAMTSEIDDQLVEANYHQVARQVIHDGCLYGTGILKGPVVINRTRKQWTQVDGPVFDLQITNEYRPGVEHIEVWNYFPEMAATRKELCEFEFERKYITKKQLRELAKRPGYLKDQIRKVIKETPRQISSSGGTHISRLREMAGVNVSMDSNRYELWEYHGPIDKEDLMACGCEVDGDDELDDHDGIVTFINGVVIKSDLNPLETGESPYSVFCYEDDDTSVFGFGIPHLLKNEQRIANAAWRMVLDNAALSTGPQTVVNRELVTPSDGAWDLKPRKLWWLNDPDYKVEDVFATFEIASHQAELMQIFEMARSLGDDVTSLPMLAQGEQGDAPDTAKGTSILMNASNVVMRRVIKGFDDLTKAFITRMYNWNMQNSPKEEIKGDFEIDARGSSVLLVKETQTQALLNLMELAQQPFFSDLTKHAALYRKAVQAQHMNPDDIIKTDDEIESEQSQPSAEQQHQQRMMQLQQEDLQAKVDKTVSDTFEKNMKGLYESMQAGQTLVSMQGIAPVADELSKSAGFKDANGYPIAGNAPIPANVPLVNLNPQTDPLTPPSPADGVGTGIETLRNDGFQ